MANCKKTEVWSGKEVKKKAQKSLAPICRLCHSLSGPVVLSSSSQKSPFFVVSTQRARSYRSKGGCASSLVLVRCGRSFFLSEWSFPYLLYLLQRYVSVLMVAGCMLHDHQWKTVHILSFLLCRRPFVPFRPRPFHHPYSTCSGYVFFSEMLEGRSQEAEET